MSIDPGQQPYGDPVPEELGASPHISDYWTVIARRLWLVLVIFTVTTASSIWTISQAQISYSASMALQVNDPAQRQAGLVNIPRMNSVNLFVDPIQSDIQVLGSASIREDVVDSTGMRLARVPGDQLRSTIIRDVWVAQDVLDYQNFRLVYNADGTHARFIRASDGALLGEAPAGTLLVSEQFRFFVVGIVGEEPRAFELTTLPKRQAASEISFLSVPRVQTNIVDVSMVHYDPVLLVHILNSAGLALRDHGAEKVRESARSNEEFIQSQLDNSSGTLGDSRDALKNFKTSREFTTLSLQERSLAA